MLGRRQFHYGPQRAQVCDLWLPPSAWLGTRGGRRSLPVVVLVHGGFWRSVYTKVLMRGLAAAVVSRGWAAWNVEYRRVGPGGGGGGWPATLDDMSAAMARLSSVPGVDTARVATCGHSAGGQLALWAAAQPGVTVRAAVSLAGVLDLEDAATQDMGGGAVQGFLGGTPDEVPERYAQASPLARLPLGVRQLVVHGSADTTVPPAMSARYHEAAVAAGDDVRHVELAGVGHHEVTNRRGDAFRAVAQYLEDVFS